MSECVAFVLPEALDRLVTGDRTSVCSFIEGKKSSSVFFLNTSDVNAGCFFLFSKSEITKNTIPARCLLKVFLVVCYVIRTEHRTICISKGKCTEALSIFFIQ